MVLVEAVVFERDGDAREVRAELGERQRMPAAGGVVGEFRERVAAGIEERERARLWVGPEEGSGDGDGPGENEHDDGDGARRRRRRARRTMPPASGRAVASGDEMAVFSRSSEAGCGLGVNITLICLSSYVCHPERSEERA